MDSTRIIEFLSLGTGLFNDLHRHSFSSNAQLAEILLCRAEEYVKGLVGILLLSDWDEVVCGEMATTIADVQGYINNFNERFNDFGNKHDEA